MKFPADNGSLQERGKKHERSVRIRNLFRNGSISGALPFGDPKDNKWPNRRLSKPRFSKWRKKKKKGHNTEQMRWAMPDDSTATQAADRRS